MNLSPSRLDNLAHLACRTRFPEQGSLTWRSRPAEIKTSWRQTVSRLFEEFTNLFGPPPELNLELTLKVKNTLLRKAPLLKSDLLLLFPETNLTQSLEFLLSSGFIKDTKGLLSLNRQ